MRYVVGSPSCGPFTIAREFETKEAAIADTEKNHGPVLDGMTWDDEGEEVIMLVVSD